MRFLFLVITFVNLSLHSKSQNEVDSICTKICKSIKHLKEPTDSGKVWEVVDKCSYNYLAQFNDADRDSIESDIYFRLQRNCYIFKEMLDRYSSPNENWKTVTKKPKSKLNKSDCKQFAAISKYKYIEENGDTTYLKIENNIWLDNFKDGTYSKLKIIWRIHCDFVIEFIESNNNIRKRYSKPGDKYKYTIIDKFKDYYLMAVEIGAGSKKYSLFKLYL